MDNQELAKQLQEIKELLTQQMIPAINNLTQEKGSYVSKSDFSKMLEIVQQVQKQQEELEVAVRATQEALAKTNELSDISLKLSQTLLSNNSPDVKLRTINDLIKSEVEADSVEIIYNNDAMRNDESIIPYAKYLDMAETADKPIVSPDNKVAVVPYYDNTSESPMAFAVLKSDNVDNSPFTKLSEIESNSHLGQTLAVAISSVHKEVANNELIKLNHQLNHRICYDKLTEVAMTKDGLYSYYEDKILPIFENAAMGRDVPCVMVGYADFNNFAEVNNLYGHEAGDAAIKHLAKTINAELRQDDALVRMGGDEFVIVVTAPTVEDGLKAFERIKDKVNESPITITPNFSDITTAEGIEELEVLRSISMGVSYLDNNNLQSLLAPHLQEDGIHGGYKIVTDKIKEADNLMYESKDNYHKYAPKIPDSQENKWKEDLGSRIAAAKVEDIILNQIKSAPLNVAVPNDIKPVMDSVIAEKANNVKVYSSIIDKIDGKSVINPYLADDKTSIARMELCKNGVTVNLALVVEGKANIVFDGIEYSTAEPNKFPPELTDTILKDGVSNLQVYAEDGYELPHVMAYYEFTDKDGNRSELISEPYTKSIQLVDRAQENNIKEYAAEKLDNYIKEHNLDKNKEVNKDKSNNDRDDR